MSYNTRRSYNSGVGTVGQRRSQPNQGSFGYQLNANSHQQEKQFHGQQHQKNQGNQNQKPHQSNQQYNNQQSPQKQPNQQQKQQNQQQKQPNQQQKPPNQQQNKPDQQQNKPDQQQNKPDQQQNKPDQQQKQPDQQQNKPDQQQKQPDQQQKQPNQQQNEQQNPISQLTQASQQQLQQIQQEKQQQPAPMNEDENEVEMKDEEKSEVAASPKTGASNEGTKEKPFWIKKTIRIPRAERVRRRNMRLKKVLQPKNALMVLNELVGQTEYVVTDSKTDYNQDIFNATLSVEGHKFTGTGKSKVAAKTAAAETAIRAIILKRLRNPAGNVTPNQQQTNLTSIPMEEDSIKMEEEQKEEDLSWSQIASFAIFKLLSNWDDVDGGNLVDLFSTMNSSADGPPSAPPSTSTSLTNLSAEPKPAKKMPENAAHLNPSMLLNQMFPHTKYEEVGRVANQTNVQFTISCVVDGKTFTGTGPNKKTAKKNAAFEACKALLNIEYPPEVYSQKMQVDPSPF